MIIKKYSAEFVFETFKDERIYYYEGIVKKSPSQKEFINTPVRDKKSQIKVGNLAIYLYLYS